MPLANAKQRQGWQYHRMIQCPVTSVHVKYAGAFCVMYLDTLVNTDWLTDASPSFLRSRVRPKFPRRDF